MILKTISWSLIYNEGAPLSEVVRRLHDKSIKDVLRVITTLCNVINQVDFDNINQDALAQGYLPENVYVELKRSVDLKKEAHRVPQVKSIR